MSLATAGDVLLDCVGVMDIQSKSAFVGQTNAALSMLSASIQKIHSQGKIEMFAGGGLGPSACGMSGPSAPADAGPPGAAMENVTSKVCAALSATSAGFGFRDSLAVPGIASKIPAVIVAGIAGYGVKGAFGALSSGGPPSGPKDLEQRAKMNVKMVAGKKISGLAPQMISSKTLGKFEVKSLLVTDFTTVLFSNFALAKFEVKSLVWFKTTSLAFEVEGTTSVEITTPEFTGQAKIIKMKGDTKVEKIMDVLGKTKCKNKLTVEHDTLMHDKLTVSLDTEVKGTLEVKMDGKVKDTTTVAKDVKTKSVFFKAKVILGF